MDIQVDSPHLLSGPERIALRLVAADTRRRVPPPRAPLVQIEMTLPPAMCTPEHAREFALETERAADA